MIADVIYGAKGERRIIVLQVDSYKNAAMAYHREMLENQSHMFSGKYRRIE